LVDRLTFLGHSTVLVDLDGMRLLTDPVFGHMAMAIRRRGSPVLPGELGPISAIFISHGHWDHLDLPSLRALSGSGDPAFIVPVGLGKVVGRVSRGAVHEVRPGDRLHIGGVLMEATRADHGTRRSPLTSSESALGLIVAGSSSVYFAGDTDLFPGMADLSGRVDVALLPVGGWGARLGRGHLNPARAAEATARIRPSVATPIHFGTLFPFGMGRLLGRRSADPAEAFRRAIAARGLPVEVRILRPGESFELPAASTRAPGTAASARDRGASQ
jgi:L-ascorbate metabolism protein UlaG (beta-lactamase superfamily)